jgi:hypothetical protein
MAWVVMCASTAARADGAGGKALELPWGAGLTDTERAALDKTVVCADGKSHFVVVAPHPHTSLQLFDGDGKKFVSVPREGMIGGDWFLEPRYFRKGSNPSFRGLDMRVYSQVTVARDGKGCTLRCGEGERPLKVLAPDEARAMLLAASFAPSPQRFRPYALMRDDRGRYYFVDRGAQPGDEKRFRLFVGPKGALVEQKMTNVVSDSEGDVFSTKTGDLRLVIDRTAPALWIHGQKRVELKRVPVEQNLTMIYTELGTYLGQRLGTPCDDW